MPYRIPEASCPGLSRDTTFTLQTSSYQQVFCSINSRSVFFNGTFFNKENATDERTFVSYLRVSCAVCTPYDRFLLLMRLLSLPTQKTLIKVIAYYIECYPKVVPESRKNPLLVIVTLSCICIGIRPWKF